MADLSAVILVRRLFGVLVDLPAFGGFTRLWRTYPIK